MKEDLVLVQYFILENTPNNNHVVLQLFITMKYFF